MTLVISKGITLAKANNGIVDPDAIIYINNVEKADGENLEYDTAKAIHDFVVGCKADGIWNAIKASCILAGARTLNGALVPLVGTAPTNFNFASGDYNRKTGLVGNGSTKYLDTNRANASDPQDSSHNASYVTFSGSGAIISAGLTTAANNIFDDGGTVFVRNRSGSPQTVSRPIIGFVGHSRSSSTSFSIRTNGATTSPNIASLAPTVANVVVFQRNNALFSSHRLAFYSIGESLDLALLDARVTDLINAFGAAF
jgi:hypothetical protein